MNPANKYLDVSNAFFRNIDLGLVAGNRIGIHHGPIPCAVLPSLTGVQAYAGPLQDRRQQIGETTLSLRKLPFQPVEAMFWRPGPWSGKQASPIAAVTTS